MSGILWIVATPIGNLEDISARAIKVLADVDLIAAEDTRHSGRLLKHLGITTRMLSLHDHNERERTPALIERLKGGQQLALISDAGTPLISDPGFRLVAAAREAGLTVSPLPGPCAAIAALSVSGLPCERFIFEGFLPARAEARHRRLMELSAESRTLILYESGKRIEACLQAITQVMGDKRQLVLARELTKQFETVLTGSAPDLLQQIADDADNKRGEIVLLVAAADEGPLTLEARTVLEVLLEELPASRAAKLAARLTSADRRELYALARTMKK